MSLHPSRLPVTCVHQIFKYVMEIVRYHMLKIFHIPQIPVVDTLVHLTKALRGFDVLLCQGVLSIGLHHWE